MGRNITIKDVAKALGISVSTVSRALRNTHDVSEETRFRVMEMSKDLNYRPNYNAKGLANGGSHNIGIVLPFLTNYYFSTVLTGAQEVAYKAKYNIIPYVTNDCSETEIDIIKTLPLSSLDGLLISTSSFVPEHFTELSSLGIPVVFFDRVTQSNELSKVTQDDYNGAFQATEHLIEQGYTKLAHITGPSGLDFTEKRKNGYLAALDKHRMKFNPQWIINSGFSQEDGLHDMSSLLSLEDPPDAVFAVNDRKAVGSILALKKKGIEVGKSMGVIGFTNDPIGTLVSPDLSTMVEPALEMGRMSCELLLKHIQRSSFEPREIILPTSLIKRGSTIRA